MKAEIAVCGTVNIDSVIQVKRLPRPDEAVPVSRTYRTMGGTASNIAYGAAGLGVTVELVGETGPEFIEEFFPKLVEAGVGLSNLLEVEPEPICHVILAEDEKQSYLMDRGPTLDWAERLDMERTEAITTCANHFHLGTGHPSFYIRLVETLQETSGISIALDPSQDLAYHYDEQTLRQLLPHADLLFCSAFELDLLRSLLNLPESDRKATRVLHSLGPATVIVTRGKGGSTIYTEKEALLVPAIPPQCKVVSPTGAGDGFRAGFYAARHLGLDLAEHGLAGAAVASLVLENREPVVQGMDWELVAERMDRFAP